MKRTLCLLSLLVVACGDDASPMAVPETSSSSGGPASTSETPVDDPVEPRADLGVELPAVCDSACAVASVCQGVPAADCLLRCTGELDAAFGVGDACGSQREVLEGCLGMLSCEELAAHDAGDVSPCRDAQQQVSLACASPGGEPPAVCEDFCAAVDGCGLSDVDACLAACVEARANAADTGSDCATAQDQQFVCVAALDCAALESWVSATDTSSCPNDLDQACSGAPE